MVPGYKFSVCSYVFGMMPERIVRELELHRFGLEILPTSDLFCPTEDGGFILLSGDMRRTQESFARFSTRDAETFPAFEAHLREAADILRQLLWETPVDPSKRDWRSLKELASLVWRYRKVGGRMYRVADLLTQSADDYLSRWFEHDVVKGMLAYYSSVGTFAGPRSPGTAYVLIHHLMNEHDEEAAWGFARGGMGAVSNAIAASGARFGLEVKTDSPVAEVMVENGRARGVRTAAGDEYRARVVISNANCRTLFGKLVGRDQLPTEFMAEIDSLPDLLDRLQDQPGDRRAAVVSGLRQGEMRFRLSEPHPPRSHRRLPRARLRRREIRLVLGSSVHLAGRSDHGR